MPWTTGLQAMHSVRTAGLSTPIVVMTALRDPKIAEQVGALGRGATLLYKPFGIERLYAAMQSALDSAATPGEALACPASRAQIAPGRRGGAAARRVRPPAPVLDHAASVRLVPVLSGGVRRLVARRPAWRAGVDRGVGRARVAVLLFRRPTRCSSTSRSTTCRPRPSSRLASRLACSTTSCAGPTSRSPVYERTREIDKLKTQLYAQVSHELRTRLTMVRADRALARRPRAPDEMRRDLDVVARNARTLLRHINELLDVAKLETEAAVADYVEVDVTHLLRFVASLFEVLAEENHVELTVEVPPSAVPRSIRTGCAGSCRTSCRTRSVHARGAARCASRCARSMADACSRWPTAAPAFRPSAATWCSSRSRRSGSSTKPPRRYGGTGVGLAIVRELVALHHGVVSVGEAPEGGALFTVDLPRDAPPSASVEPVLHEPEAIAADIQHAVAELRHHVAPQLASSGTGPLVLVVEDNPELNLFVCQALAATDEYRVLSARDGREGLALAAARHPDLVVADVMMPELSGEGLVRAVRQRAELDATAIVMLTAKDDEALRVELLRRGADDFLVKPFFVEELRARVANLIARKRAEEQTARLIDEIERVADANMAVADAIAGLPSSSLRAVLQTIALKAQTLTMAKYAAVGIGTDPELPFDPWVFVGMSAERAAMLGKDRVRAACSAWSRRGKRSGSATCGCIRRRSGSRRIIFR